MTWINLLSYWSMMGFAMQSAHWERSMNAKLVQMGEATGRAASLQAAATENQELAAAAQEQAATDEEQATSLQGEAETLMEKSQADEALAASKQVEAEGLEAEIVTEEDQSAAAAAAAVANEGIFEGEMAEGTADAGEATRIESNARGEEVVVGFCEFVPFLDVACDVVGGISAIGLEAGAAAEAAKAATEYAAAVTAKADEQREAVLAAELQAKAGEDIGMAAELQAQEAELTELAETERTEGEADEAAAEALLDEAATEQESAAENEEQAVAEEQQSGAAAREAVLHGVGACWDAIMAGVVGIIAAGYFAIRVLSTLVIPCTIQTVGFVASLLSANDSTRPQRLRTLAGHVSYFIHHCAIFFLSLGSLGKVMSEMNYLSIRARGGMILCFALLAAFVQAFALHSLPRGLFPASWQPLHIFFGLLKRTLFLMLFFSIELLILWVHLGKVLLSPLPTAALGKLALWIVFAAMLLLHLWFFELPTPTNNEVVSDEEEQSSETNAKKPVETDSLLYAGVRRSLSSVATDSSTCMEFLFKQELPKLQIPFEVLVLSCMFALLKHSFSSTRTLWPVVRPLVWSSRPKGGFVVACIAIGVLTLILVVSNIMEHRRRRVARQ